ncbi:MAG: methionine sulfoxide reductase A [Candidatus Woesebacteria bacterium GW2011_GWB1_38_8]|uniref:Peptide methionine sulfoxide reductase MsrA n=2 Tax=Candidatus Woeseibacteriota TaxID=1752722 RepID=A0A0G0LBM2_9BACT|nr:MAG: methionine sulfoxide reductase A [Candidatus Woesebacteria bacterium GW2011_GWB1_38_8]OGM21783.1 MAG: peptide-methionine (S)-S-oxide reductase [Candidatus Woesebacteria bacterium RIFCSPHIGHO2_01_FULL_38_9b]
MKRNAAEAYFAGGCFWCTQALFNNLKGVDGVEVGYSGGMLSNPSYEAVSSGSTNHAETIKIIFDPKIISYKDLIYVFLRTHDPTTMNRQGTDVGTQYRSVIFYANDEQKKTALKEIKKAQKLYSNPIVTQVIPSGAFYKAEKYHQDYYVKNPQKPYCTLVIDPKIQKLKKEFKEYLKSS